MTISVAHSLNTANSATGSTLALAFSVSLTAGDTIHAAASSDTSGGATVSSFSDGTNTYGSVLDAQNDATHKQSLAHCVAQNCAAGTPTVTVNFSVSAVNRGLWIKNITGCATSSLDGHSGNVQLSPGTGTDAVTSGNATNTNQPALISAFCTDTLNQNEVPAAGTGFTSEGAGWNNQYGAGATNTAIAENKRITTTTAVAATFTAPVNDPYATVMAIFDEFGVGAPAPILMGGICL